MPCVGAAAAAGGVRLEEYGKRGSEPEGELQIYTWPDATLRELTELIKDVRRDACNRCGGVWGRGGGGGSGRARSARQVRQQDRQVSRSRAVLEGCVCTSATAGTGVCRCTSIC